MDVPSLSDEDRSPRSVCVIPSPSSGRGDPHLVRHVAGAGHLDGLGFNGSLLVVGADGSFERQLSALRDHLHVMRVAGQGFVLDQGLSDLLSELPIAGIFLLLIGGYGTFARSRIFAFVLSGAVWAFTAIAKIIETPVRTIAWPGRLR
jgi:hypothetical protein